MDNDREIKEIDSKISVLKNEEKHIEQKHKIEVIDQTAEAIETLRECVKEVLTIDDLGDNRKANPQIYNNRILTIVSWFNYLKSKKQDTREYAEAKALIISIGQKHERLADWCKELIDAPLSKPSVLLWNVELNVDVTNELFLKDDSKIVVNVDKAKELIDTQWLLGTKEYNELNFEYQVVVNNKKYNCLYHIVNYLPKCECPEDCPYFVSLISWEKSNNKRILKFNVIELDFIKK